MADNNRFSVAIHIVTYLACKGGEGATSNMLATSIGTNPVVVRRLLSQLHKANLIETQSGKSGGSRLGKRPEQITLFDVYKAVEQGGPFAIPSKPENKACLVSCHMKEMLSDIFRQTELAIESSLKKTTVAELLKSVMTVAA